MIDKYTGLETTQRNKNESSFRTQTPSGGKKTFKNITHPLLLKTIILPFHNNNYPSKTNNPALTNNNPPFAKNNAAFN